MIVPVISYIMMACSGSPAPTTDTINEGKPLVYTSLKSSEKEIYLNAIKPIYEKQLLKTGFNGAILIAKNGEVVFEDYQGMINFSTKEPITPSSTFHVASVSKTFTAMTILRLMEQGRLALTDPVE
ncbi:MAG: serine hydrolase domain-containing protein, partial [Sediminibacterium sp.]|nr:serine hydrolase domain-containing protein [Sediminibacterium sp.]